jgi:hypothetical protein
VHTYYQSREIVEHWVRREPKLSLANWSDSYVLYSEDDLDTSFWQMEQSTRWIINEHLMRHIPIRGAVACGPVYVVSEDDIFIGGPLIEAYEHGENQNWIGFLLCRSATGRLRRLGLAPSRRLNYRGWRIPWNKKKRGLRPLYAYLIGASSSSRGKNDCLEALQQMMARAQSRKDKHKYRETIEFLEHHGVSSG